MVLSAISTPLLGIVDTAVVGHMDSPVYLGAVAIGATIFTTLFMSLNFLRMGTTGIAAQAFGADENNAIREALGQATLTALVLAGLILITQSWLLDVALKLLSPGDEVAALSREYFHIRVWSAPFWLVNFVFVGWLLGMQNARGPLVILITINSVNILLDIWFVVGLNLGVTGVALGSVIAEVVGAIVAAVYVRQELRQRAGDWSGVKLLAPGRYRRLFDVNANLFIRTVALMLVFGFMTAQGARLGDAVLAANAILLNLQYLLSYALDGVAHAAEALVGKAYGARTRAGLLLAVRRTLQWSIGFAACFTFAYLVAGDLLIGLMTGLPSVGEVAAAYLPWLVLSPLISVWSFLYDGVYVGVTRSREMMLVMVGSAIGLFLPAWWLFQELGNHAIWLGFTLFMAGRGIGMHWWFKRMLSDGSLPAIQHGGETV